MTKIDPTKSLPLEIRLLGAFELKVRGVVEAKVPAAAQGLLALLILHSKSPLSRQSLAQALWPDSSSEQANFYFRRTLSQLRNLLGDESDRISSDLSIDLTHCRCDLDTFCSNAGSDPATAIEAYSGMLVVGKRNHRFEAITRQLSEQYQAALSKIAELHEASGDYASAIRLARQVLAEDRTSEASWRRLIRLLGLQRDHVGAARAFRQLRLILREELGIEPEPESTELYHRVMSESDVLRVRPQNLVPPKLANPRLPTPLTALIGRDRDLEVVRTALSNRRLVLLVGLGGVGKSRLAVEIAETWSPSASIGVARIQGVEDLRAVLALDQLFLSGLDHGRKSLLLVDNAEHILEPVREVVEELLSQNPDLVVLVTSRKRATWPGATTYHLAPLELPEGSESSISTLSEIPAIRLFIERAHAADAEFSLNPRNAQSVASICRKLDGLPLAIELAAAKARSMPAAEIDRRLTDRFALLQRKGAAQTLTTVLDWCFEELSEDERRLFLALVALPGSWSFEMCESIFEDFAPEHIDTLVALDLVTFEGGRYRCFQIVREYGLRKKGIPPSLFGKIATFYFREVEARFPALEGAIYSQAVEWFFREEANLAWVLQLASESSDGELVRQALVLYTQLYNFWMRTGKASVGHRLGACILEGKTEPSEELAAALFSLGGLAHRMALLDQAEKVLAEADAMSKLLGLHSWRGESLLRRAELLSDRAKLSEAIYLLNEALQEFTILGNSPKQAACLRNLGYAERERGRYDQAIEFTRRALKIHTEMNDSLGRCWCVGSLGATYLHAGNAQQAVLHFSENIQVAKEIGELDTQIWNLLMLAEAQLRLRQFELAEVNVREALGAYHPETNEVQLEWATSLLGEILTELGQYEAAEQLLARAWRIHGLAGTSKLGAHTMVRRAELHLRWGRRVTALAFFELAEDLVRRSEVGHLNEVFESLKKKLG